MEIMTSRMLINLYKAHEGTKHFSLSNSIVEDPIQFRVLPTRTIKNEGYDSDQ